MSKRRICGEVNGEPRRGGSGVWGDVSNIWGYVGGLRGDISELWGNVSRILGDVGGLRGDISGISGNVSGLRGDCTGLHGNASGLDFDLDTIPTTRRPLDITTLRSPEGGCQDGNG